MDYRLLGRTGLKVSSLCMGTMTFGRNDWGVGSLEQDAANEMVSACIDHGVNFFDTANVYSAGNSEEVLGEAIRGRRHDLIVATKVRGRMGDGPNEIGLSRRHIMDQVDQSLRRLGTDWIDLYQVHCWDNLTRLEDTLSTLDALVRSGKVRSIGCSNYTAWQIERSMQLCERHHWTPFSSVQPYYSLVGRDIEHEIVPVCRDHGLAILPWSPLGGSFLAGRYRRGEPRPEGSRRSDREKAFLPIDEEQGFDIVEALYDIGAAHDASPAQVALNWLRAKESVTSVIIGARTMANLVDNLRAATWELSADEVARLDELSARPAPYPTWFIRQAHATR
jgi:aryl-alcohol dehydrogenase-like predicted oxidoreductase